MRKLDVKSSAKYEAPRLQTYGKLHELTKGTIAGSTDLDLVTKEDTP